MSNEYYNSTGWPQTGASGASANARTELAAIEAGFDKLAPMAGNGGQVLVVNTGGTAQDVSGKTIAQLIADAAASLAGTDISVNTLTSTVATGTAPIVVASNTQVANLNASKLAGADWAAPAAIGTTTPAAGTFTVGTFISARSTKAALGANNIDCATGDAFSKTVSANTTFTVSNVPASGTLYAFTLDLTNGGAYTVTWWSGVKWAGGTAPTLTASGRDRLVFTTTDGGTTWDGFLIGKGMA